MWKHSKTVAMLKRLKGVVLRACLTSKTIKRVVYTSAALAVSYDGKEEEKDESSWIRFRDKDYSPAGHYRVTEPCPTRTSSEREPSKRNTPWTTSSELLKVENFASSLWIRRRQSVLGSKITGKWRVPFIVVSSWLLLHFLTIASDYIP
ncbi:hypothetical protein K1719_036275 [Acacia pycnantha]|nr:hypothetical protein K1719_036275 [Acacia pycnantha]